MVKYERFFSERVKLALKNGPPGSWMPSISDPCIRLSAGYPAPELMPSREIVHAVETLIDEEHDLPLHYVGSPRRNQLSLQVQKILNRRGIKVDLNDSLLITSGGCQAIDLIANALLDENCVVAVEEPTYMEALEIFRNYTSQFMIVPMDEHGIQTHVLEAMLIRRRDAGLDVPRLLYTIPSFHNPTGTTLTFERRQKLLELAETFNFLILEDDAYGELSFSGDPVPLKKMDEFGRVAYVGSLSKVVAPGLRIGWMLGPSVLIEACSWIKKDLDHPFSEATAATYLQEVDFEKRINKLQAAYQGRRNVMIRALEAHMPDFVSWHVPQGGFFVWLHTPGVNTTELLSKALRVGLSFVPGQYFFTNEASGVHFLRLSFSYVSEEQLEQGVIQLGSLLKQWM